LKEEGASDLEFHGLHPGHASDIPFPIHPFAAADYSLKGICGLGLAARRAKADLLHVPHFTLPWPHPPTVLTVHDLIHLRFPGEFGWFRTLLLRVFLRRALRRAALVITVSEASRADLLAFQPALEPRLRVIPNAALPEYYRDRSVPREDFFLFVGNAKPHKGIPTLLDAWGRYHASHPEERLVVVTPGAFTGPGIEVRRGVPRDAMPALTASARALVAPSLWEGFGLPVLEAVLLRTPVVASDIPAHRELLGGDHPLLFPAGNTAALHLRLEEVRRRGVSDQRLEALRSRHLARGPRSMAAATLEVYREALGTRRLP
jgi:glycosyltransferase involved in cell wall biosynthesis